MRTVPVLVSANGYQLKVNAILDDGSTKTYINEDIAEELGIKNRYENVTVTTLNGKSENFRTMSVNFNVRSLDGNAHVNMEANTTQRVTGNLKPIDWNHYSQNWPHLKGLQFPSIGRKPRIDLLIGLDYSELHRSLGELIDAEGSPTARLTPLGWTCVGPVKKEMQNEISMFTFHSDCQIEDVNDILKRFWEVENINDHKHLLTTEDKKVVEFMKEKTFYDDENQRYEVHVPWKQSKCSLTNNCEMAKKRLESTE